LESFLLSLLNGLSYGLLLFMLSAGLTLIFSMMGVLNFAHASFYMLGAYFAATLSARIGFWPALLLAPLAVGLLGAWFEAACLRPLHRHGHVAELLVTFGLGYVVLELVQLAWGRQPLDFQPPELLQGPAFTLVQDAGRGASWTWGAADAAVCRAAGVICHPFPATRVFAVVVALLMWLGLWLLLQASRIGLVVQAALTQPEMVEALGHNLPRVFMGVFGVGAALAGLAGVVGGSIFVTEPGMAAAVGPVIFVVVVVGGLGSLSGALLASLLIALLQTFAVAYDGTLLQAVQWLGWAPAADAPLLPLLDVSLAQVAPMLPYLLLVLVLLLRPAGLFGRRLA
jgi:branched-chain amino acid transport system permease protein